MIRARAKSILLALLVLPAISIAGEPKRPNEPGPGYYEFQIQVLQAYAGSPESGGVVAPIFTDPNDQKEQQP